MSPSSTFPSCVTLGKCFNLSESPFLICTMGIMRISLLKAKEQFQITGDQKDMATRRRM